MLLKHAFSQAGAQRTRDGDGGGWRHLLPLGWCLNVDGTQVTVSTVAVSPELIIIRTVTSSHTQSLDVCQYRIRSKLLSQLADFLFSAAAVAMRAYISINKRIFTVTSFFVTAPCDLDCE